VTEPFYEIVVPTAGRASLARLEARLHELEIPCERVHVILDAGRRGPAWARNRGLRAATAEWVVFLDDDVVPETDWRERLEEDLAAAGGRVAGVQGRIRVPLPSGRRPTDWERNVRSLETAQWATADLAYRRAALLRVGGFDERFRHAFREDSEVGLRLKQAGYEIERGSRTVVHPVGPAGRWTSVRLQRGNADDALMRGLHGRGWQRAAGAPRGRRPLHLLTAAAGTAALAGALARRPRLAGFGAVAWLAGTAELTWARLRPGPRTREEIATVVLTSLAMPPVASYHWLAAWARLPRLLGDLDRGPRPRAPQAVLLDRDGTLVVDVPYNGDPARVTPVEGAREALERLRAAGIATAVVSNQSGIARGLLTLEQVEAVNQRVEALLGPLGPRFTCPHGPDAGCACRKPAPGLLLQAAEALGTKPERCALVGDIGADVEAALAAGARPVLVPNRRTRAEDVAAAPEVASSLSAAVDLLLGDRT
jgi:histidinol-phosphate phosphatase family protein